MQHISVLDLLKQGEIYRADYNKIFDKDYLRQYKFLAHQAGFEDCPIFCATEKSKNIISSSGLHKSKSNILLTLNVPDDETYCTEYYTWTDYLYFSTEKTNLEYVKELEDELKQNLIPENCSDPQIIIDRIEPSWVEGLIVDDHKNDDLEDINIDETNQTDSLYENNLLEVQSYVKSNQNKSIKRHLQNHYGITLHKGATVHHLVSHKDLIDKDNDYRLKHVVIIDGGDTQTNDAIHRLFGLVQKSDPNYDLNTFINELGKAIVYYIDDNDNLITSNFKSLCTDKSIKLRDSKVIEDDDDQIINESSEDILRLSDDLSDRYIRKYFNNYHKELVSLDDILKDTDNLHDNAMKTRRTEVWGQDPDLYKYDTNKGYYGSLREPIRVAKINGKFIVLDGNHRLRALANNGYKQIEVLVRNI